VFVWVSACGPSFLFVCSIFFFFSFFLFVLPLSLSNRMDEDAAQNWGRLFDFPVPGPNATCPHLMLDENKNEPRNFRSPRFFVPPADTKIDFRGFSDLPISANAQCGDKGWKTVVETIKKHHAGIIVNLSMRQESYAFVRLKETDVFTFPEGENLFFFFLFVFLFTL
jgi:hypothetical protein